MFKTLSSVAAAQLDRELMSSGAFSIDQLMELAGLAVAQAIHREYPPLQQSNSILVLVGPGNNGGDGLVASRHLKLWGYNPILYYPKKSKNNELYQRLLKQLQDLDVPEVSEIKPLLECGPTTSSPYLIVDALFGFSFKPPIRAPFDDVLEYLSIPKLLQRPPLPPIVSIDIPSGWDVDLGPTKGSLNPKMLISLTAPKPCASQFASEHGKVHYLGGRFINDQIATKYDIKELTSLYKGDDMILKLQ